MSTTVDHNNQFGGGSGEETSSKECTSCEQDNIDNITEGIDKVSILGDKSTCASCGKEGYSDDMNTCNKCKSVKYCNAACKKKHRTKHKKKCDRRVAELYDEQLFKEPQLQEECPICFLTMPIHVEEASYQTCCGKLICNGCMYAMMKNEGIDICVFCRTPTATSDEENMKRTNKLMRAGNSGAFSFLAFAYDNGRFGMSRNYEKANELFLKSGELGCAAGYHSLGNSYYNGDGVKMDNEKAKYYWELAAMMGNIISRNNLGIMELNVYNNRRRAYKHYVIAARAGCTDSLDDIKEMFMKGFVTKDEYASTLRAYHERQKEMKSDARVKAAASGMFNMG